MYLYGASGHAKVVIDILRAEKVSIDGLIDDDPEKCELMSYPIYHDTKDKYPIIISIGDNRIRKRVAERLLGKFGKAIHPSAIISEFAILGEGSVVMQGSIVQSCAFIGKHCIINTGVSIDHECRLEDYVHVSPHATLCGNVTVGEGSWIGAGSIIIPGVKIGRWSVVGAGTVVSQDIPDGKLVVGNRTKTIKSLNIDVLRNVNWKE